MDPPQSWKWSGGRGRATPLPGLTSAVALCGRGTRTSRWWVRVSHLTALGESCTFTGYAMHIAFPTKTPAQPTPPPWACVCKHTKTWAGTDALHQARTRVCWGVCVKGNGDEGGTTPTHRGRGRQWLTSPLQPGAERERVQVHRQAHTSVCGPPRGDTAASPQGLPWILTPLLLHPDIPIGDSKL